jgi:hypothetical protein
MILFAMEFLTTAGSRDDLMHDCVVAKLHRQFGVAAAAAAMVVSSYMDKQCSMDS